ncbi:ubiquitin-2 like Rad60 SUMO-like-domain-containing protein [Aspergillus coremiiformis]|uniref:Ubiquitin-2 like Rad60 SUMO-like-domain-containing protein n=1 Tax=Aspergillus coremiiformis TaxID=138285 RepID=A0A5N6YTY3_9EURO|nr:ubiquitin-2 like Rad60 SUMO-like-domain-containing protein [Aspergillus coremiiformis]
MSPVFPDGSPEKSDIQDIPPPGLSHYQVLPEACDSNGCHLSNFKSSNTGAVQPTHSKPYPSITADVFKTERTHPNISVPRTNQQKVTTHTDPDSDSMPDDVVVQILITSKLENTKPLIVRRKMSQSLRDVRLAWCDSQNVPKATQSSVFLTWMGRRLFDVTTCRSLGIKVTGGLTDSLRHDDYLQHGSKEDIRIHMEAVAEDNVIVTNNQQAMRISWSESAQEFTTIDDSNKHLSVRVVLKCPGLDDLRLRVSSNMQISQLVSVFCDVKKLPESQKVYLVFDGDRLDPSCYLIDYNMADDDLVDVIIK